MKKYFLCACILISAALGGHILVSGASTEELTIAAASDLNFAIKEVIAKFEAANSTKVKLSLGSSGNFYAQLQNGAPFDLYFSADIGYPRNWKRRA